MKYQILQMDYERQKKELAEMRSALEGLKRENKLKTKECQEACKSLQELQNELMRKSMHVGSLGNEFLSLFFLLISCKYLIVVIRNEMMLLLCIAFAIEGQVKEKSRWFSSLRDMTRKVKVKIGTQ